MNLHSYRWANVTITFKIISNESHSINVALSRILSCAGICIGFPGNWMIPGIQDYELPECHKGKVYKHGEGPFRSLLCVAITCENYQFNDYSVTTTFLVKLSPSQVMNFTRYAPDS